MEDNFKLAEVLVDELDQSERSNFERQLVGLRIKQSALEEDFSEKAFEKQTLTEDIVSCNATLEEYINKLKDKEQELTATKKITQEDKELNTNYQKEIKELEKKILQKKLENENLYQIVSNSKPELEQLSLQHLKYIQTEKEMNLKLDALQERIQQKELELQTQEISFRQFSEYLRNRSVSPVRVPRRGLDSPLRLKNREAESIRSAHVEPRIKRRTVEELVQHSAPRGPRKLLYVILILSVIIIALILGKIINPQYA